MKGWKVCKLSDPFPFDNHEKSAILKNMENPVNLQLKNTGSLTNWMMAGGSTGEPKVGEGATEFCWTDRTTYWVTYVSEDGKQCNIVRAKAVRTDNNGMSDAQDYRYEHYEKEGEPIRLVFKWGAWRRFEKNSVEKRYPKIAIKFGVMREYHDYSF